METQQKRQSSIPEDRFLRRSGLGLSAALSLALLGGCASSPPRHSVERISLSPVPVVSPHVYFYPQSGQSAAQQDRDRFECYNWAVKKTGFDPGQSRFVPRERIEVVAVPSPGTQTAAGVVTGALIGAAVSRRHETLEGAVVGAVAGGIIGAVSDASRQEQAAEAQARYARRQDVQNTARTGQQTQDFRNAMSACLEGRNYSVR